MYTLLPAMKNANARLLLQAIDEMRQTYTDAHLGRHLLRFKTILHRSKTVSEQDKKIVEDRLNMYDSLLDNDPDIKKRTLQAKIQGRQEAVIVLVTARFPTLTEFAKNRVIQVESTDKLDQLTQQIALAPDEATVRWALG